MVEIISKPDSCATFVALEKHNLFYSAGVTPEVDERIARIDTLTGGMKRIIARKDIILVVEGLWRNPCTGANHVLFIREDRTNEGARSLLFTRSCIRPILCQVLIDVNAPYLESVGGFDRVLVYGDEIAVTGSAKGPYGWIIKRGDIARYYQKAAKLNPMPEEVKRLKIRHEIHIGPDCEKIAVVRVEGWSDPPLDRDTTLWELNEYAVLYGEKTRVVQRILLTNSHVNLLPCDRAPLRSVALGKRLPKCLGQER